MNPEPQPGSRVARCYFCGPLDFPATAVTPQRVREWMDAHAATDSHRAMIHLAAELDNAIYAPPSMDADADDG